MNVIHKFPLIPSFDGIAHLEMPKGARILSVQTQREQPCVWAIVNPEAPKEKRKFWVRGTGHTMADEWLEKAHYYGTFQMEEGALVFHLFEIPPESLP